MVADQDPVLKHCAIENLSYEIVSFGLDYFGDGLRHTRCLRY